MAHFSLKEKGQEEVRSLIHRLRAYRLVRNLLIGFILVAICNLLFSSLFFTPKMFRLADEKRELKLKYEILQSRIRSSQRQIEQIRHRDNHVYRPLFASDTMAIEGIYNPYDDSKYADIWGDEYSPVMVGMWHEMDQLARSLYQESVSLDELQHLTKDKEKFSTAIPAIWPIDRTKLRSVSSLFGMRKHPRYGTWRKHEGVDLAAPKGTPVYATGNAVVREARWRNGYGNLIELNHGFGYKTRYGHLHKMYVKEGDSVTRGQVIGEVGNTGVSEGSHLHYEVRFRDNTVNPIHYFNKDMSPEAYVELMEQIDG